MFFWPSVFLEAWGTKAKTPHMFEEPGGFLALPPSAARPTNKPFLEQVWFFGLGTPGLQTTTWQPSTSGIPLRTPPCFGFSLLGPIDVPTHPSRLLSSPPTFFQRDPDVVCWPSGFLEAWGARANKPHIFKKFVFLLALPPKAARPNNHSCLGHVRFFGPWCPRPPKTPLGQQIMSGSV